MGLLRPNGFAPKWFCAQMVLRPNGFAPKWVFLVMKFWIWRKKKKLGENKKPVVW
jgi:hypothetical protein